MRMLKIKKKRKKQIVDQISATNILNSFMKSSRKTKLDLDNYKKIIAK
jgi:RNase H-fold protein (predicted Holliday junction resolvase)